ncbi:MFS transporter [Amycolatopsis thermoflava]|uniref:MFS transporter n=1 Tax=Amycolatopsis thermoflava TaxID=84480 RepID=UPI003668D984
MVEPSVRKPTTASAPSTETGDVEVPARRASGVRTKKRWVIAGFCFAGLAINYVDRSALSVALPFMTEDFHLTPAEQGLILSAFSWTYALLQLPAGALIDRFGTRVMFGASVMLWSAFTLTTTLASGFASLLGFRLGLGVGESGAYPSSAKAISQWFPRQERGRATAFYDSGARVGSALAVPVVAAITGLFGWQAVFVIMGTIGILWAVGWWAYYRSPEKHPGVNAAELSHIQAGNAAPSTAATTTTVPAGRVRDLLRHRTVWGMFAGFSCLNFVVTFFLTWFPSYLVEERGFDLLKLGFFGVIPGLTAIVGSWAGGAVGDALLARGWSLTRTRKTCLVSGMLTSSVIMAAVLTEAAWLALALLSLSYFASAFTMVSVWCLPADVAPEHQVGVLGGGQNFVANVASAVSPIVIGALAGATGSFVAPLILTGAVAVLGALSFGLVIRRVETLHTSGT